MNRDAIEKSLAAFSFGQIQDFVTLHGVMREHNISVMHLEDYVKTEQARQAGQMKEAQKQWERIPDCPVCGGKLSIRPIRLPKGPANREGWKSLWYCTAGDCVYEVYSRLTVEDEIKKAGFDTKKCH